jgi:hypothetical protein
MPKIDINSPEFTKAMDKIDELNHRRRAALAKGDKTAARAAWVEMMQVRVATGIVEDLQTGLAPEDA